MAGTSRNPSGKWRQAIPLKGARVWKLEAYSTVLRVS